MNGSMSVLTSIMAQGNAVGESCDRVSCHHSLLRVRKGQALRMHVHCRADRSMHSGLHWMRTVFL